MKVGCVKELKTREYRVGTIPDHVTELVRHGHKVFIESRAGDGCGYGDESYKAAGASICETAEEVWNQSDLIVKVKEPLKSEYQYLREGLIIFTYLHLAAEHELARELVDRGVISLAYETVHDGFGQLPLLKPMSAIAGRLSVQEGAKYLEKQYGGKGRLLMGVPGVRRGRIVIIGVGIVGSNACNVAVGLGADVVAFDNNMNSLTQIDEIFGNRVQTLFPSDDAILRELRDADVVIGSVLIAGANTPKLIKKSYLKEMQPGSVIVDVAIDQGGCAESSYATTHDDPIYVQEGILHYCVANMPGAVPMTSTIALCNATLPYLITLADLGLKGICEKNPYFYETINTMDHHITHPAVAQSLNRDYVDPKTLMNII